MKNLKELQDYFKPGSIVPAYAGQDRVISFDIHEPGNLYYGSNWSVTVIAVDKAGNEIGQQRTHCTKPTHSSLKS